MKYRIYDKEKKEFFEPIYEAYKGRLYDLSITTSGEVLRRTLEHCCEHESKFPDRYTVQFGCEVNGIMVYEGDLIGSNAIVDGNPHTSKLPIIFDNGAFWVDESFKKDGTYMTLLCEYDEPIKVCGNVFEN